MGMDMGIVDLDLDLDLGLGILLLGMDMDMDTHIMEDQGDCWMGLIVGLSCRRLRDRRVRLYHGRMEREGAKKEEEDAEQRMCRLRGMGLQEAAEGRGSLLGQACLDLK